MFWSWHRHELVNSQKSPLVKSVFYWHSFVPKEKTQSWTNYIDGPLCGQLPCTALLHLSFWLFTCYLLRCGDMNLIHEIDARNKFQSILFCPSWDNWDQSLRQTDIQSHKFFDTINVCLESCIVYLPNCFPCRGIS